MKTTAIFLALLFSTTSLFAQVRGQGVRADQIVVNTSGMAIATNASLQASIALLDASISAGAAIYDQSLNTFDDVAFNSIALGTNAPISDWPSGGASSYTNLTDVPTEFPPEAHEHDAAAVTNAPWLTTEADDLQSTALRGAAITNTVTLTGIRAPEGSGTIMYADDGTPAMVVGTESTAYVAIYHGLSVGGTNVMTEISGKATVAQLNSATRTPHIIAWSTNIAPALADGISQAVTNTPDSASLITWPAAPLASECMINLTIPPRGTNTVDLSSANGATFAFVPPLASTNAVSATNTTHTIAVNAAGSTNWYVTIFEGAAK